MDHHVYDAWIEVLYRYVESWTKYLRGILYPAMPEELLYLIGVSDLIISLVEEHP